MEVSASARRKESASSLRKHVVKLASLDSDDEPHQTAAAPPAAELPSNRKLPTMKRPVRTYSGAASLIPNPQTAEEKERRRLLEVLDRYAAHFPEKRINVSGVAHAPIEALRAFVEETESMLCGFGSGSSAKPGIEVSVIKYAGQMLERFFPNYCKGMAGELELAAKDMELQFKVLRLKYAMAMSIEKQIALSLGMAALDVVQVNRERMKQEEAAAAELDEARNKFRHRSERRVVVEEPPDEFIQAVPVEQQTPTDSAEI